MLYQRVAIAAASYVLPDEVVTTAEIERRLAPLYDRLKLPEGRLELMTGIRERRFFPPATRISDVSIRTARLAIEQSGLDPALLGALIHGSVCRDQLEPATACRVHHAVGLPAACQVYDVSNACLGILTGAVQIANLIELGQIRAGVVVGTECGRELVENTIAGLNADESLTRASIKNSIASLTIGSASAALVLCATELAPQGHRFLGGACRADSSWNQLCQSEGLAQQMQTDSETLLREGVQSGVQNFNAFLSELGWSASDIHKTVCHQVGVAHRKLMLDSLGLDPARDFSTFEWLGNTGAAALPASLAIAAERGHFVQGERVGLLGIGSGINCLMLGVEW
jgi:acyl-CoA:acyl-CoA alkyltransferase